ncbi:MAG TPA: cytochrome c [Anaerolineaceae bacterium]|nr:cytochrome c [Anaerolineaceae bacterium]
MDDWNDGVQSGSHGRHRSSRLIRTMIGVGTILLLIYGLGFVSPAIAQAPGYHDIASVAQSGSEGQAIFEEKCTGCHSIGGGRLVGPDLKDVTNRRDLQWIKSFLLDPPKMEDSDPIAQQLVKDNNNVRMPNLGLTAGQVDQLIQFLANPGAVPPAAAPAGGATGGESNAGKKSFTGEDRLSRGGPPCMACHTVSGAGILGGGGLGPDLTHVITRLGEPGLAAAIKTISFPTMIGPFQDHPLTPKEQADLIAFFKDSDQWQDPVDNVSPGNLSRNALNILGIGLLIAGLLLLFLLIFWKRILKRTALKLPVRKV